MRTPFCCGQRMEISLDLGRFLEMKCNRCGDVVYIKPVAMEIMNERI